MLLPLGMLMCLLLVVVEVVVSAVAVLVREHPAVAVLVGMSTQPTCIYLLVH
jgi:hypothetical protein